MSRTGCQNTDKTSRARALYPDKTLLVRILIWHSLFFLYANIFLSQFEPLFGLPRDTLFGEYFWSRSKNSQHVFYWNKNTGVAARFWNITKSTASNSKLLVCRFLLLVFHAVCNHYGNVRFPFITWKIFQERCTSVWLVCSSRHFKSPVMVPQTAHS